MHPFFFPNHTCHSLPWNGRQSCSRRPLLLFMPCFRFLLLFMGSVSLAQVASPFSGQRFLCVMRRSSLLGAQLFSFRESLSSLRELTSFPPQRGCSFFFDEQRFSTGLPSESPSSVFFRSLFVPSLQSRSPCSLRFVCPCKRSLGKHVQRRRRDFFPGVRGVLSPPAQTSLSNQKRPLCRWRSDRHHPGSSR